MRAGFWLLSVILAPWLAGCVPPAEVAPPEFAPQSASCAVRRDAELALRVERNFFLLPATLDGHPVQMLLDTGAEVSTISPVLADAFGLERDVEHGRVLRGVGGDVHTASVVSRGFAIGDMQPMPERFSLGTASLLPGLSPPVAGLLGADLLAGAELELDAPHRRAALFSVARCPDFRPWPGAAGVALTQTASGLGYVVADLDGSAVRAVLDTGARTSLMTRRLAIALGVTDAMLAADPGAVKIGISRADISVRQHRFDRISLGPVTWRDVPVAVADVSLPGSDMLLGADLLGRQPIWISPARSMLWLR